MEPLHIHEVHLWCARPETLAASPRPGIRILKLHALTAERRTNIG
jgi:hypothetical protein